jgi:hypothetical protein
MATPKHPRSYGPGFARNLHTALRDGEAIIELATNRDARALRSRYYAFRKALARSPEWDPLLYLSLSIIRFTVRGNLLIIHRGDT